MTFSHCFSPLHRFQWFFLLWISGREYKKSRRYENGGGKKTSGVLQKGGRSGVDFFLQCDDDGTVLSVADAVCGQRGVAFQRDMDDSAVV